MTNSGDVTLTLYSIAYDDDWHPIAVPVVGVSITIDGVKTEYVTDENGAAVVRLDGGDHVFSAVSNAQTLVPPACKLNDTRKVGDADGNSVVNMMDVLIAYRAASGHMELAPAVQYLVDFDNNNVLNMADVMYFYRFASGQSAELVKSDIDTLD
ncbi:MAG: hypothetical protein IJU16_02345, partial [Clostridia bacterium]|nr:hypothetical protein [Clostridia bacterium]